MEKAEKIAKVEAKVERRKNMKEQTTTIRISKNTAEKLKNKGKKGETYDEIINRFLESSPSNS